MCETWRRHTEALEAVVVKCHHTEATSTTPPPRRHTATEVRPPLAETFTPKKRRPRPWRPPHQYMKAEALEKAHRHQYHTEATATTATSEGRGGGKTLYHTATTEAVAT